MFSKAEKQFLKNIGIHADFDNISDDELVKIEEKVSLYLQKRGLSNSCV